MCTVLNSIVILDLRQGKRIEVYFPNVFCATLSVFSSARNYAHRVFSKWVDSLFIIFRHKITKIRSDEQEKTNKMHFTTCSGYVETSSDYNIRGRNEDYCSFLCCWMYSSRFLPSIRSKHERAVLGAVNPTMSQSEIEDISPIRISLFSSSTLYAVMYSCILL